MNFFKRLFGDRRDDDPEGEGNLSFTAGSHGSDVRPLVDSPPATVEAEVLVNEGRYEEALELLQSSQPESGQEEHHRHYIADCKLHLQRVEEARSELEQLLQQEPDNPEFLISASWAAQLDRDYDKAIAYADEALRYSEDDPGALNNRGFAKICAGQFQEAIVDLRKAVGVDRSLDHARVNLAQAYLILEDYERAEYEARRLAERGDRRVPGFILLHHIRQQHGDQLGALKVARRARKAAPRDPSALALLMDSLGDLGQEKELAETWAYCKESDLPPSELAELEARLALRTGDFEKVVQVCTQGIEADPNAHALRHHRMHAWAALGKFESAWEDHNAYLKHIDTPWHQLGWRWMLLFEMHRDEEAIQVVEESPYELPTVLRSAGLVNSFIGDRADSVALADRLAERTRLRSTDVANCFIVYFNAGKMDQARDVVERHDAILMRAEVTMYKACLSVQAEDWKDAHEQLKEAEHELINSKGAAVTFDPDMMWHVWASLHALRSALPDADRAAEQSTAMRFVHRSHKTGNWLKRYQWYLPWLHPLRESDAFREFCGQ